MSVFDSMMADTVGVVWRASTGNVDPWTKSELIDQETQGNIQAGADPATAQVQAQQDVTNTLKTFSLGNGDRVGADPSQSHFSIPSWQALKDAMNSATHDDGSGCSITNLGGCIHIPTWVPWAVGGVLVLGVLYVLAPYVGLARDVAGRR